MTKYILYIDLTPHPSIHPFIQLCLFMAIYSLSLNLIAEFQSNSTCRFMHVLGCFWIYVFWVWRAILVLWQKVASYKICMLFVYEVFKRHFYLVLCSTIIDNDCMDTLEHFHLWLCVFINHWGQFLTIYMSLKDI